MPNAPLSGLLERGAFGLSLRREFRGTVAEKENLTGPGMVVRQVDSVRPVKGSVETGLHRAMQEQS